MPFLLTVVSFISGLPGSGSLAFAEFQFKKGSFAKRTTVGAQSVAGVGFQHKKWRTVSYEENPKHLYA